MSLLGLRAAESVSIHTLVKSVTSGVRTGLAADTVSIHTLVKSVTALPPDGTSQTLSFNPHAREERDPQRASSGFAAPVSIHTLVKSVTKTAAEMLTHYEFQSTRS